MAIWKTNDSAQNFMFVVKKRHPISSLVERKKFAYHKKKTVEIIGKILLSFKQGEVIFHAVIFYRGGDILEISDQ